MNLKTLPLVNPRYHIGKLKGFACFYRLKPLCEPILMPI